MFFSTCQNLSISMSVEWHSVPINEEKSPLQACSEVSYRPLSPFSTELNCINVRVDLRSFLAMAARFSTPYLSMACIEEPDGMSTRLVLLPTYETKVAVLLQPKIMATNVPKTRVSFKSVQRAFRSCNVRLKYIGVLIDCG